MGRKKLGETKKEKAFRELKELIVNRITTNQAAHSTTSAYTLEDIRSAYPVIYYKALKSLLESGAVLKRFGVNFLFYRVPDQIIEN